MLLIRSTTKKNHMKFLWRNTNISIGLDKSGYRVNIFHISSQKHQGASNGYPQHMFLWKNKKISILLGWKKATYTQELCISVFFVFFAKKESLPRAMEIFVSGTL